MDEPLLRAGSPTLTAVTEGLSSRQPLLSFLAPGRHSLVRITALTCPPDVPQHLLALVLAAPPGPLSGLTRCELEILGLVVEGWPNDRIARHAVSAEPAVASHVENILTKLGVASRTLAAVRALRLGLYVPRPLGGALRDGVDPQT